MEQKLVKVPFDIETAKKITNCEIKGKIVTRDGRAARVICWDRNGTSYPLIALVSNVGKEVCILYTSRGTYNGHIEKDPKDLLLEIPECLTFTDGEVVVQSWERDGHYCKWVSIIRDAELWDNDKIATTDYFSVCIDADDNNKFKPWFGGMSNTATDIRKADDSEKEIVINTLKESKDERAKNYLKRFFDIEQKNEPKFNPGQPVIGMDGSGKWRYDLFSHMNGSLYVCTGRSYKMCLPFNDKTAHLLGTNKDYKEE